ncbi:unnamed protein product [Plutella xylostella]|uniref:(diamondback moth) hypothetical protein n=1 Tax=Plutella xylostella TaxID=51655 RepID=A0A8S4EAD4_PLUXY|nr:unnamed protein product [Plutella xylostella]
MNTLLYEKQIIDAFLKEWDDTAMPLPSLEAEPHLLISKVRKHYLEYLIQLLSSNYETNQKLLGKNIYLPSAIWRCAKILEINAVKSCMVIDLYRRSILSVIQELKLDTKRGKLNRKLLELLQSPPGNEKKTQTNLDLPKNCNCPCACNMAITDKKKRKLSPNTINNEQNYPNPYKGNMSDIGILCKDVHTGFKESESDNLYKIPVIMNSRNETPEAIPISQTNIEQVQTPKMVESDTSVNESSKVATMPRMSTDSQEAEDQIMLQLEQIFRVDSNGLEDDLFEGTLCDMLDTTTNGVQDSTKALLDGLDDCSKSLQHNDSAVEDQAAKIKSLDDRLAMLETSGVLQATTVNVPEKTNYENTMKQKKPAQTKWLCELYYQRLYLFEKMDEIRDSNRKKYTRIKDKFLELFGEDSDDEEDVMSPLDETPEFVLSCKERIAPWIVKLLTPHYVKGRIRGKTLFKALAKHLIGLIYQCSHYPSEYEVHSFVNDFLKNHKLIRCEADFREFRIENI